MARVTLQTIADAVGVSRTTVSNAFSRPDQLAAGLREQILAKAEELGYPGPNPAARMLRRGEAKVIGVLFTETLSYAFADPYAVGFLQGLAGVLEEAGTGLLLVAWPSQGAADDVVRDAVVDGFCVFSLPDDHPTMRGVLRRRLPVVIVDEPYIPGVPFIGVDSRAAGRKAAGHLLSLGHRRIGVIAAWPADGTSERRSGVDVLEQHTLGFNRGLLYGYRDAFAAAGLDWGQVPLYRVPNTREAGHGAGHGLLDLDLRPTAILATSDQLALGAIEAAAVRGLRIPRDLSIVGFDDLPTAQEIGLTTIRQPMIDKGRAAARLLLETARRPEPSRILMPHQLIVRESTAPPATVSGSG